MVNFSLHCSLGVWVHLHCCMSQKYHFGQINNNYVHQGKRSGMNPFLFFSSLPLAAVPKEIRSTDDGGALLISTLSYLYVLTAH